MGWGWGRRNHIVTKFSSNDLINLQKFYDFSWSYCFSEEYLKTVSSWQTSSIGANRSRTLPCLTGRFYKSKRLKFLNQHFVGSTSGGNLKASGTIREAPVYLLLQGPSYLARVVGNPSPSDLQVIGLQTVFKALPPARSIFMEEYQRVIKAKLGINIFFHLIILSEDNQYHLFSRDVIQSPIVLLPGSHPKPSTLGYWIQLRIP